MREQGFEAAFEALWAWAEGPGSEPVVVLERDRSVRFTNATARAWFGEELAALHDRREASVELMFAALARGLAERAELRIKVAGGERIAELRGEVVGDLYVLRGRDVTEERAVEQELRRVRGLLTVGQMTASVVHDFNNVLGVVMSVAELLALDLQDGARSTMAARELRAAAEHGRGLVKHLMGVVRGEPRARTQVRLADVVRDATPLLLRVVGKKVNVELRVDEDLGDAEVDREQLVRVLLNLAANARDAMPDGGNLAIVARNVDFDPCAPPEVRTGHRYVGLLVTDDGVGMDHDLRDRVLDGFVTTKDANGGTGLGLLGAHRFVTAAGGCMSIRSAPGEGTTVALYLPRSEEGRRISQVELARVSSSGR